MTPLMRTSLYVPGLHILTQSYIQVYTKESEAQWERVIYQIKLAQQVRGEPRLEHVFDWKAKEYTNFCFCIFQPKLDPV